MTNEEAIRLLKAMMNEMVLVFDRDRKEALNMAIETLKAQPESAQWVQMLINPNLYKCSNCQVAWNKRLVFDNDGYSKNIFMKYCPCCGRKMQTEVDYE